ncbi:AAA family ATPase [Methylovulum psychrotolerans]|uniref:ATPase n=1 Tax=Methylovulum psychrotolerans TaxID=1704499 RepID=A0A1Z4BU26_9GAMM|nr:ATP-binding protein [Methylovulum psychrotolerans]ASF44732.1 ATPase [Methylovulum psychrotolerans]
MIKELRLKNWKSFADATLYIDPLTLLIGTNASGKSNALDALLFLHRLASGGYIFDAINGNGDTKLQALRGGIEWVCLKPHRQFTLEVLADGVEANQDCRYVLTVQVNQLNVELIAESLTLLTYESVGGLLPKEKDIFRYNSKDGGGGNNLCLLSSFASIPSLDGILTLNLGSALSLNQTKTFFEKDALVNINYVLAQLKQIFIFDPIPSHIRDDSPLSKKLNTDGSNIAGVLAALEPSRKEEVEATLTNYFKSLPESDIKRVWAETIGRFNSDAMLYCEEGWGEAASHEIDARGMSDGSLRYLAIVTALLTREKGSLLVIEEVDNGLHPSRAHLLLEMLRTLGKERGVDVIVTTHNPALLDAAGGKMLPFITVAHRDGKTGVSQLIQLEDVNQLPKLMASGSLGKLSTEGRIEAALKREDAQ